MGASKSDKDSRRRGQKARPPNLNAHHSTVTRGETSPLYGDRGPQQCLLLFLQCDAAGSIRADTCPITLRRYCTHWMMSPDQSSHMPTRKVTDPLALQG